MNKSFVKNVIAVILGIALLIAVYEVFSMLIGAFVVDDALKFSTDGSMNKVIEFTKWSSVGIGLLLVPALLGSVFAYFSKKRALKLVSATIWFALAVTSFTLFFVLRDIAVDSGKAETYAVAVEFMDGMITLFVMTVLLGVYFILDGVFLFGKTKEVAAYEKD